jgi:hypothetical protein
VLLVLRFAEFSSKFFDGKYCHRFFCEADAFSEIEYTAKASHSPLNGCNS